MSKSAGGTTLGAMPRETYVEFHQIGAFMKATAIDAATGIEATIVGPANAGETVLRNNALRKLEAVLRKRAAENP